MTDKLRKLRIIARGFWGGASLRFRLIFLHLLGGFDAEGAQSLLEDARGQVAQGQTGSARGSLRL